MKNKKHTNNSFLVIIVEILFALMPLIILILVTLLTTQNFPALFKKSDVSFISVFFFGQTLVRLISGIAHTKKNLRWQVISLFISVIIILGLIPTTILLIIIYQEINNSFTVYLLQNIYLIISISVYFIFGQIGQEYLDENNNSPT